MTKRTTHTPIEIETPSNYPDQKMVTDTEEVIIHEEIDPDSIPDEDIVPPPYEEPSPGEGP
jgi:hypothetical protein